MAGEPSAGEVSEMSTQDLGTQNVVTAQAGPSDRRRKCRFKMQLECRVSSPEMRFDELIGITGDVSRSGAFVVFRGRQTSAGLMQAGERARIMIELPHDSSSSPRCLDCMSKVLRVTDAGADGFCATFEIQRMRVCDRNGQAWDSLTAFVEMTGARYVN
jgi:hypothetical protein